MGNGLYSAASAMSAAERRVETISSNLANAGAVGFKRKGVVTHTFQSTLNKHMQPQISTTERTDYSQGTLRSTDSPFDLALQGSGFFTIDTPQGEVYTRNGAFHVDQNGVLQTRDGSPVAWKGGRGTIDALGKTVSVDAEGNVRQDETVLGQLKIVDFVDPSPLVTDRQGNQRPTAPMVEQAATGLVRQGFLEDANVNAIDEMVGLISAQRSFESSARTMTSIEQVLKRMTNSR